MGYFSAIPGGQIGNLQSQVSSLQSQNTSLQQKLVSLQGNLSGLGQRVGSVQQGNLSLPLMNQTTTLRQIRETWYLSPSAHQDRFDPAFPVVNQGDTVQFNLIDNDTVAHDLVIGPPYNIVINATVPGLINDLTGQKFTGPATNNSPGVVVKGSPGDVSAVFSFVAKFAGVYEFVCTYHAQVGMIGYLVVLPNAAYRTKTAAGHPATGPGTTTVNIIRGAGSNTTTKGYSPETITVVIGLNNSVTWTNNDNAPHTITADDNSFSSGNVASGQSFSFTFTTAGMYKYHCVYHPWMTGTVIVKGS